MFGRKRREQVERSGSGAPILRHAAREGEPVAAAEGDGDRRKALEEHYARYLGEDWSVWHEIVSEHVHLDVCMWRPTPARPFHTFATLGMSDLPMTVPPEAVRTGAARYAELVVSVPADWPVPDGGPWADEAAFMPVRALKTLARLPHEYGTWLGFGHAVPNGDPAEPLSGSPNLTAFAVLTPDTLPDGFRYVGRGADRVDVLSLWLLTTAETQLKLERGIEELLPILRRRGVSELLDIGRTSTVT
jgi:hypothetical protein